MDKGLDKEIVWKWRDAEMVRFRSFPSRPFYSFSSAIKNLFEARDFLLSRDRRRNAPSLIPILNQRNSRTLPRLERRFFLVPLQRATLHRRMDSSFFPI